MMTAHKGIIDQRKRAVAETEKLRIKLLDAQLANVRAKNTQVEKDYELHRLTVELRAAE